MTLLISTWVSGTQFAILPLEFEIYDSNSLPKWYEHPLLGSKCDVVAFPFARPKSTPPFMHNFANRISNIKIPVKPGGDVFVIGFPSSLSVGFGLPIWKHGSIGSEPEYDVRILGTLSPAGEMTGGYVLPAFFIDSLTREGMSGAPVFARYIGNWDMNDPNAAIDSSSESFWDRDDVALFENRIQFVGVYSSRIGSKEEGAALGLCWRADTIDAVCNAKVVGQHPHLA
jgi:hypothetical protein